MSKHTSLSLGSFEQLVMLAVLRCGEDAYGLTISDEIAARTARKISRSSLYITFHRLEKKGLIESRLDDPSIARGGRPRRYIRVTDAGMAALRTSRAELTSMWTGIDDVLDAKS